MSASWQPISQLEAFGERLDALLQSISVQYASLDSDQRSSALDDYTLGRLIAQLTVQRDELWIFDEQLRRWSSTDLIPEQRAEVRRLGGQMLQLYAQIDTLLSRAAELQRNGKNR